MLVLARSTRSVRFVAVAVLALALIGCTRAAGASSPASPAASQPPTVLATASPTPSASASASVEPTDDEVEDEDDEESPTPKPTPVAGCGTGESAFFEHTGEVDRLLTFGDSEIELTTAGIAMRDDSYVADDAIPGYVGLTKDEHAVRIGPGDRVPLTGDGMTFPAVTVAFARWSDVTFQQDQLPDLVGPRTDGASMVATDGTVSIVAPAAPGDYFVELGVHWQTACLKGDGVAYGRFKVG